MRGDCIACDALLFIRLHMDVDLCLVLKFLISYTLKEIISQTDLYLFILSSKTYVFEDKMIKY